jgi:hypothetical protein
MGKSSFGHAKGIAVLAELKLLLRGVLSGALGESSIAYVTVRIIERRG